MALLTNDEQALKDRQLELDQEARRDALELKTILGLKAGRRFIWKLMQDCGIFKLSFDGTSKTYFNEGERNVALRIFTRIQEQFPEAYVTMVTESQRGDYV